MVMREMGDRWTPYKIRLSCFLLLVLVLVQGCSSLNPEGLALLDFRAGVSRDPYGALSSWDPDDGDPCSWSNVQCINGNVQELDLNGQSLEGVLAPEIGKLTQLRRLILSHNQFYGTIPKELGELQMLEVLDLRDNNLSGNIPLELGRMHSLKHLLLCNNKLEGTIPMELGSLHFLYELQYDENLVSLVVDGIGCLNRKFGHCVWQGGFKFLKKADSVLIPIKETVNNYLKPFQKFSKSFSDNSCVSEESQSEREMVQNGDHDGNLIRRKLAEQSTNLAAAPSPMNGDAPDQILAIPSIRSSGSYPAVPKEKREAAIVPSPSPVEVAQPPPKTPTSSEQQSSTPLPNDQASEIDSDKWKIIVAVCCGLLLLILVILLFFICRNRAVKNIGPWRTGLSGQLQKAFVTGVPKLNRTELETACEEFSNIITRTEGCTLYKGTLSSGVEICVVSTTVKTLKHWSRRAEVGFRKKIDALSRVNHKNFVNLIGYCEEDEPFVRMMVFEYAPNGSLSEHLHVQELEHLDWSSRMRIVMGTAYCLQYMHELNPPVAHTYLNSTMIFLTEDYAPKIAEMSFWRDLLSKAGKASNENESEHSELPLHVDPETNVYCFGVLMLEIISGKHPHSEEYGSIVNWAARYMNERRNVNSMVDPTLESFKKHELNAVCDVIQECTHQDARKRPTMKEVTTKLREVLRISPDQATPKLSPLWWAELEILSGEAT